VAVFVVDPVIVRLEAIERVFDDDAVGVQLCLRDELSAGVADGVKERRPDPVILELPVVVRDLLVLFVTLVDVVGVRLGCTVSVELGDKVAVFVERGVEVDVLLGSIVLDSRGLLVDVQLSSILVVGKDDIDAVFDSIAVHVSRSDATPV
jgi:hypothetical protein